MTTTIENQAAAERKDRPVQLSHEGEISLICRAMPRDFWRRFAVH